MRKNYTEPRLIPYRILPASSIRLSLLVFAVLFSVQSAFSQVNYTANTRVDLYQKRFLPGINLDYLPPWDNFSLADLAAGNQALGIKGVGARTTRPGLQDKVLGVYGYDISLDDFDYFADLGMTELTAIVGFPADQNRDWANRYCGDPVKWNALFKGIYNPIWDGGANGTPYDDRNEFAKYMYEVVTLYKDQVRFWEIWNEPGLYKGTDSQVFWGEPDYPGSWWVNDPDPCDYSIHAPIEHFVRTLRIAYDIIKTVAPDDYVVLAGVGSQSFLDAVLRNTDEPTEGRVTPDYPFGGGAYFDVLGFHTYPHLDGSTYFPPTGFAERHSDGAANGVIERRLAGYQSVLASRGYDGITYPKKEHICTEIALPRVKFQSEFLGGEEAQINFMAKAVIALKLNRVHQMHVYTISDKVPVNQIGFEFDAMGMYEHLPSTPPYQQRVHEAGKAYKTVADLITDTDFDASRTAAMNVPAGVKGYAFRKDDGSYIYALWAETLTDLSEQAFASYSFPTSLIGGNGTITKYNWDYSYSNNSSVAQAGQPINLDARPVFFKAGSDTPISNEPPLPRLSTGVTNVAAGDNLAISVSWTEAVTGLTSADFIVQNAQVQGLTGSGNSYILNLIAGTSGPIRVSLPAGAAQDNQGLGSLASNMLSIDIATGGGGGGGSAVDLSLEMSSDKATVGIYDFVTFTLSLTNTGRSNASGVVVGFPKPANYAFTTATQTAGQYNDWSGTWTIGDVGAGQTVSTSITLFTLTADARVAFAEVVSVAQQDADSTPDNGDGMTPQEDDEAAVAINGGGGGTGGGGTGGGGTGTTGVDLAITLSSTASSYKIYEQIPYTVEVSNSGDQAATDVVIDFPFPVQLVHTANNATQGNFDVWLNKWQVGSLPAGASATLSLDLFPLRGMDAVEAFVQVTSQAGPADTDSTPGNGVNNIAREDDEAFLSIPPFTQSLTGNYSASNALQLNDLRVGDLLNSYFLTFTTRSNIESTAQLVDGLGRIVRDFELTVGAGTHRIEIPTDNLPSGNYYLMVVTAGRAQSLPFVITN